MHIAYVIPIFLCVCKIVSQKVMMKPSVTGNEDTLSFYSYLYSKQGSSGLQFVFQSTCTSKWNEDK